MAQAISTIQLASLAAELGFTSPVPLTDGGQKVVYSADLNGQPVIVKAIALTGPRVAETVERARREVELLRNVDSPHVVGVLSEVAVLGTPPEALGWLEERLDGEDLKVTLGQPWADADVYRLMTDLASGLAACHDRHAVHRDLSPGNVRKCADGHFVVMDPGLAKHLEQTSLTGLFQPGTPCFMTPEHYPNSRPSEATDVFGIGILAYYAATGDVPLRPTADFDDYLRKLHEDQIESILTKLPNMDPQLAAVIDRCLQRQVARRYIDAGELLEALTAAQAGSN